MHWLLDCEAASLMEHSSCKLWRSAGGADVTGGEGVVVVLVFVKALATLIGIIAATVMAIMLGWVMARVAIVLPFALAFANDSQ